MLLKRTYQLHINAVHSHTRTCTVKWYIQVFLTFFSAVISSSPEPRTSEDSYNIIDIQVMRLTAWREPQTLCMFIVWKCLSCDWQSLCFRFYSILFFHLVEMYKIYYYYHYAERMLSWQSFNTSKEPFKDQLKNRKEEIPHFCQVRLCSNASVTHFSMDGLRIVSNCVHGGLLVLWQR